MRKSVDEVIESISKVKSKKTKIEALKHCIQTCEPLLTVFRLMYDKEVSFDLPEGNPPYRAAPKESDLQGYLYGEFRRIRYFIKGQHPEIKANKKESLFIEFLESMDQDDAKLLLAIKDKKSPYPGITKKLIKETFKEAKDW